MKSSDRRWAAVVLVFLLGTLCGVILLWPKPAEITSIGSNETSARTASVAPLDVCSNGATDGEPERRIPTNNSATRPRELTPDVGSTKQWQVLVNTISLDGSRIADLSFEYIVVPRRILESMSESQWMSLPWTNGATDKTGVARIDVSAPEGREVYLIARPLSLIWLLPETRRTPQIGFANAESFPISDNDSIELRLRRNNRLTLNIRYADGVPFAGRVVAVIQGPSPSTNEKHGFLARRDVLASAENPCEIEIPEGAAILRVRAIGLRFGFLNMHTANLELNAATRTLEVVIPEETHPWAGVHLELHEFSHDGGWTISLSGDGSVISEGVLEWGKAYDNYCLHPGRDLVIRMSGPLGVWESETFRLAQNEVRSFTPVVAAGVTVSLRIVDVNGRPQYPGYASTRFHDMANWQWARAKGAQILVPVSNGQTTRAAADSGGAQAFAARDGTVELAGIAPSVSHLFVEAPGSERTRVPLNVRAGDVVDLGDVVVVPAVGEITLRFKNVPEGVTLKVCLIRMPIVGDMEVLPAGTTEHVFKNVSTGRGSYAAWTSRGQGYKPAQVEVSINPDSPKAEIEIDVGDMKPGVGMTVEQEGKGD